MEWSQPNQNVLETTNELRKEECHIYQQSVLDYQEQSKKQKLKLKKDQKQKRRISLQVQIQPLSEYSSEQIQRQQDQNVKQYKRKVQQQQKNAENSFSFLQKFKSEENFENHQTIREGKLQLNTFILGYQSRSKNAKDKMRGKPIKIPHFSFNKQQVQPPKIQKGQSMLQVDQTQGKIQSQEKQIHQNAQKKRYKQEQKQEQCVIIEKPKQIRAKKEQIAIQKVQPSITKQNRQLDKYYLPSRAKVVEKSGQKTAAFTQDVSTTIRMFQILYQRGYTVCRHPDQEYDLLIIGKKLKPSQKLLMAIMLNKKVYSERWLWNPAFKMNEDICGYSWSRVEKAFGSAGNIFGKDGKKYYISQQLRDEYAPLVIIGGGTVYNEVNSSKKSSDMILVITKKDRDFYMHWRTSKKWKFVSHHMIVISILLGEQVIDKYVVGDKYFLDYQYLK